MKSVNTNPYAKYLKKQDKPKKAAPQSIGLVILACMLAGGSGWYIYAGDIEIDKLLSKIEISVLANADAADTPNAEEKTAETKADGGEKSAVAVDPEKTASKKSWTDEEINLFSKLESRKSQLDAREAELNKLEEELHKQKDTLEKRLTDLEDVRTKISAKLDEKVKVDGHKVDSLVSVYSNMKPAQAAKVIEGINEDLAVEVLTKMKNKSAAEILNLMDSEKAKKISERFAGYREPASK